MPERFTPSPSLARKLAFSAWKTFALFLLPLVVFYAYAYGDKPLQLTLYYLPVFGVASLLLTCFATWLWYRIHADYWIELRDEGVHLFCSNADNFFPWDAIDFISIGKATTRFQLLDRVNAHEVYFINHEEQRQIYKSYAQHRILA